jgi:hypothetical protein
MLDHHPRKLLSDVGRRQVFDAALVRAASSNVNLRPSEHQWSAKILNSAAGLALWLVLRFGPCGLTDANAGAWGRRARGRRARWT